MPPEDVTRYDQRGIKIKTQPGYDASAVAVAKGMEPDETGMTPLAKAAAAAEERRKKRAAAIKEKAEGAPDTSASPRPDTATKPED
jgi:hypothetical protein